MPINLALCGSGVFAQSAYLPAIQTVSNIKLHTIWSRSSKSTDALLNEAQSIHLVKGEGDVKIRNGPEGFDEVLNDPEVDAVSLVLPITAQPELIIKALQAGKHVISEKPVGKDVQTAKELIERYEKEFEPKGLIWRVAENYNHDQSMRLARDIMRTNKDIGPVLYWQLQTHNYVADGSKYQATSWRTIPDYQGGFLLDGGVHFAAMLRTILPSPPNRVTAHTSLHRTHLPPHDTIIGIARSDDNSTVDPHGPPTQLKTLLSTKDIPVPLGRSTPQGTIIFAWGSPEMSPEDKLPTSLTITCLNAIVVVSGSSQGWTVEVRPTPSSPVSPFKQEQKGNGVAVELKEWAEAVEARKKGVEVEKENFGHPRLALWDLALVQGLLTSEGKEVDLASLTG